MNLVNKLTVKFNGRIVGTLAMTSDNNRCAFSYDQDWLDSGFSISPLDLPLTNELFIAKPKPFYGNFGVFEDSLPDGYGRYLLNRILRRNGIDDLSLNVLQRLSIIGSSGMGALSYEPESILGEHKILPSFDELQQLALNVLSEKTEDNIDVLYFNSGNSGGCRPKCLYSDKEGHWLVKFRHTYDPEDMGQMEYYYNLAARKCGINVPDFKLIDGKYFASKRFDIATDGSRLHVATAGALLNESIQMPACDYKTILHLTGYLTQSPSEVEEMFRRMVFNVLMENKDDHVKNFSYIFDNNKWNLAPAYDLTYSTQGYRGEHATSVLGKGNPTVEDMIAVGATIRISKNKAEEIIEQVYAVRSKLGQF